MFGCYSQLEKVSKSCISTGSMQHCAHGEIARRVRKMSGAFKQASAVSTVLCRSCGRADGIAQHTEGGSVPSLFRGATCSVVSCNSAQDFGSNVFEAINDLGRTTMKSLDCFFLSRAQTGKLLLGVQLHHLLRHIASGPGDGVVAPSPLQNTRSCDETCVIMVPGHHKFGAALNQGLGTRCHATVIMLMPGDVETHFFSEVTHFIGQGIPEASFGVSNLGPDSGGLRPQMPVGSKRDTEFSVTHCADERRGTKDFLTGMRLRETFNAAPGSAERESGMRRERVKKASAPSTMASVRKVFPTSCTRPLVWDLQSPGTLPFLLPTLTEKMCSMCSLATSSPCRARFARAVETPSMLTSLLALAQFDVHGLWKPGHSADSAGILYCASPNDALCLVTAHHAEQVFLAFSLASRSDDRIFLNRIAGYGSGGFLVVLWSSGFVQRKMWQVFAAQRVTTRRRMEIAGTSSLCQHTTTETGANDVIAKAPLPIALSGLAFDEEVEGAIVSAKSVAGRFPFERYTHTKVLRPRFARFPSHLTGSQSLLFFLVLTLSSLCTSRHVVVSSLRRFHAPAVFASARCGSTG